MGTFGHYPPRYRYDMLLNMAVKEKITALLAALNKGIYEKADVMALALLSSIAGESIFLLGPPGVAKSLIARRLKYAYEKGNVFEYLMSRFSTPDEIFGPVSISKLKDKDKYERVIEGYLPSADVVFLDEIWKAGPSIQNALLTVINEKKFRNGDTEIDVPMKALISASNELPAQDEGLEALWDRFLIRLYVDGIKDTDIFNKMISETLNLYEDPVSEAIKIRDEEYKAWSKQIDGIKIPDHVFKVIDVIRKKIAADTENDDTEHPVYISDRRWRKIIRLLRASAFLNDRQEVDLMDCFLIKDCIWDEDSRRDAVFQYVSAAVEEHGYTVSLDFSGLKQELTDFTTEITEETKFVKDTRVEVLKNMHDGYYEIIGVPANQNLIKQSDFNSLTNSNVSERLYYWNASYGRIESYSQYSYNNSFNLRKGNTKFTVFVNDNEHDLKTVVQGEKRQTTKKVNEKLEKLWDDQVNQYLQQTEKWIEEIESYRNKDMEHLRTNIFVKPELANIVETHIVVLLYNTENK